MATDCRCCVCVVSGGCVLHVMYVCVWLLYLFVCLFACLFVCETVCVLRVHSFHYPRAFRCLLATMIDLPRSRNGRSVAPAHVMRLHPCTRVEMMVERIRVPPNTTHDHGGLHFLTPIVVLHVSALRHHKLGGLAPFPLD